MMYTQNIFKANITNFYGEAFAFLVSIGNIYNIFW